MRWLADLRYAARTLRRAPGFTVVAVLTLALGIGANTAIFSVVNGVLIQPLPFPDADRLVRIFHTAPGLGYDQFGISPGIFFQYEEQNDVFESMALYTDVQVNLTGDGDPERVDAVTVSRSIFSVLGIAPVRGRTFTEDEVVPDGPDVVMIGHELWTNRFGAEESLLGRTIQVNGVAREVIGILPPDPGFPNDVADLWFPFPENRTADDAGNFAFQSVARLKPGVSVERAEGELVPLVERLRETYASLDSFIAFLNQGNFGALVKPMKEEIVGDLKQPLWILLGTVGVVLLIVCANVANLCLVRAEGRRREMAVRSALGAGRGNLMRQYAAESVLLAIAGGALGVGLAAIGVPALLSVAPPTLPRLDDVRIDLVVLLFALAVSTLSAVLFGLIPALRNSGANLLTTLQTAGRGTITTGTRQYFRSTLVVTQTALALILLVGSGLLVRSFWELRNVDPGFDTTDVLTFRLALPQAQYAGAVDAAQFHQRLLERLSGLPGVQSVGGVAHLPLSQESSGTAHEIADQPTPAGELPPMFWYSFATPGYFETMRIPVMAGRAFERRDHEQAFGNVVISSVLAERLWPEEDALGKRIRTVGDTTGWETVVGVVGSVHDRGLREEASEIMYRPMVGRNGDNSGTVRAMTYTIRGQNSPALTSAIRAAVWDMDPELPITALETMSSVVSRSVVRLSFTMMALVVAAVMAVVLGAIGLYGVLSYMVSQRRQEIGVRIALGAQASSVRRMVVGQGARLALLGVGLGLAGSAALTRLLQGLLFGTAPLDPLAFSVTSLGLLGVVMLASYLPARKASNVDPIEALRME
jgi:predicted permease